MRKLDIQPGMRFDRLSIVKEVEPQKYPSRGSSRKFECLCDCGNQINVLLCHLRNNNTKSCGCFRNEITIERNTKHNHNRRNKTIPEYQIWKGMKQRCTNPKRKSWKNYGGRGIKVCDQWLNSFENFLEDMGKRPSLQYSIDRIDVNGNYEPSNCRWATPTEQNNNKRKLTFT